MTLEEAIKHCEEKSMIYNIDLIRSTNTVEKITVCSVFGDKKKAEDIRKSIEGNLAQASSPYIVRISIKDIPFENLGIMRYVTTEDIENEFKIVRYDEHIVLKPMSPSAHNDITSDSSERGSELRLIETFGSNLLTTVNKKVNLSDERLDRIFKSMLYDFIDDLLHHNCTIREYHIHIYNYFNDHEKEFPMSLRDIDKVTQEQNEHADMVCDALNRADSNIWICQDLYTTYNDLLGVFYIVDEDDRPYRFVISRYHGQVIIELVEFTSFGIFFNDIKDQDQKEFIEELSKYLDMVDDLTEHGKNEYNALMLRNYIVKIVERKFNMASKLANRNRLYVFLLKRVIEEKNMKRVLENE